MYSITDLITEVSLNISQTNFVRNEGLFLYFMSRLYRIGNKLGFRCPLAFLCWTSELCMPLSRRCSTSSFATRDLSGLVHWTTCSQYGSSCAIVGVLTYHCPISVHAISLKILSDVNCQGCMEEAICRLLVFKRNDIRVVTGHCLIGRHISRLGTPYNNGDRKIRYYTSISSSKQIQGFV